MGDLYEVYVCSSTDFPDDKPNEATSNLMPQRSKELYTNAYKRFEKYMLENSISSITENVMLNYMTDLSSKCKCSSLWPTYSMLRSTLNSAHNVDIQTFTNLRAYVKQQSIGYQPKKSKVFTKYDFRRFLCAPDLKYLMHKVLQCRLWEICASFCFLFNTCSALDCAQVFLHFCRLLFLCNLKNANSSLKIQKIGGSSGNTGI